MSTAGKVLSVLILLVSLGWIFLAAGVAQLNRNGNERLAKLATEVENAKSGLEKAQADLVQIKNGTANFQRGMDTQIAVIRTRTTDVEAANSRLKSILNDLQAQLANMEATVAQAGHDRDVRKQEREDEIKLVAEARAEVSRLRGVDGELTERLASLRDEFMKKFKDNMDAVASATR